MGIPAKALPRPLDAALAVALFVLTMVLAATDPVEGAVGAVSVIGGALACAPVAFRDRLPVWVAFVSLVGCVLVAVFGVFQTSLQIALGVALYSVASRRERGVSVRIGLFSALCLTVADLSRGEYLFAPSALWWVLSVGAAVSIGYSVRVHRERLADLRDRARRAEERREEEARRRVMEERLRIARELHDVVAHNITLINVQAEVAAHLLREDPDEAERALTHVREGGRSVLAEMSALLSVMRAEEGEGPPTAPAPSLERLSKLVEAFEEAGVAVDYRVEGAPAGLPSGTDLVAYRIVQEALTNARRHGGGGVRVRLRHGEGGLSIDVRNPLPPSTERRRRSTEGSGSGIIGMRERVAAVGGNLWTGNVDDGFLVRAFLPAGEAHDRREPVPGGEEGV
ncbi:sensor histidine kinase [Nocardiopsis alba]